MDILLSMLGIIILLALCAGVVFFAIAMAKKIGLIRESTLEQGGISQGLSSSNIKPYLAKLKTFNQSLAFRFVLIVVLVAVMNIPLDMVRNVVSERHQPHSSVLLDIAGTWGEEQHLQGPTLLVPYTEKINTVKYRSKNYI